MYRFRDILPPPVALWLFALAYVGTLCLESFVSIFLSSVPENPFGCARLAVCTIAALGFGGFRALWNHPLVRPGYFAWLQATPWRFPDPLAAGPPHWVWQDGLVVGVLVLLALGAPSNELYFVPSAFISGYVVMLSVVTAATGIYWPAYATVFSFGLIGIIDFYSAGLLRMIPLVIAYSVGRWGLRSSLAAYPWDEQFDEAEHRWQGAMGFSAEARSRFTRKRAVGFPYAALAPSGKNLEVSYGHGYALAITATWVAFVILVECENSFVSKDVAKSILVLAPGLAALLRIVIYCVQYWPPISLLGRILTFRWIIPGYDCVFLTPIATLACGYGVGALAWGGLLSFQVAAPLVVFVSTAIALNGGPSMATWKLTGHHRMIAASASLNDCKKV